MGTFANFSAYVASEAKSPFGRRRQKEENRGGGEKNRRNRARGIWSRRKKRTEEKEVEREKEQLTAEDHRERGRIRKRATESVGASFQLIRPTMRKKLNKSGRVLSPQSHAAPRLSLACRGINQSRYHHPATMTIVRISKEKTL